MRQIEETPKTPVVFKRSRRTSNARVLTSMDAGQSIPIRFDPVLREDSGTGTITATVVMQETPETVLNTVQVKMLSYFVPFLAFEQFNGSIEEMNKRYEGSPSLFGDGVQVEPFFKTDHYWDTSALVEKTFTSPVFDAPSLLSNVKEFYNRAGIHMGVNNVNNSFVQSYNCLHNYRRKSRSPQLAQRNQYDHSFAEVFWPSAGMSPIVADYDAKLIAGEVSLQNLDTSFNVPIKSNMMLPVNDGGTVQSDITAPTGIPGTTGMNNLPSSERANIDIVGTQYVWNDIRAELASTAGTATLNLADIDQARQTAAFAKLRSLYSGNTNYGDDDDFLIDLLMQGIRIPVEAMKDPILVGRSQGAISQSERYATDAANLDAHVSQGAVTLSHRISVPQTNTGGILVTVIEIAPERIFERTKEHFLQGVKDADQLPNALVDYLDPEKVEVVTKEHLDVQHTQGGAILGYQPKNMHWNRNDIRVGGKFFRPEDDNTYVQDRARIWSNEVIDPELSTDFYLTTKINKKVFSDQASDSFEVMASQNMTFTGLTQFGEALLETDGTSDYDTITQQVDADKAVT